VEAMHMAARYYCAMGYTDVDPEAAIKTNWASPEVRNQQTDAATAQIEAALGVPQEALWALRLGYGPEQIEEFKRMKARADAASLTNVLTSLQSMQPTTATTRQTAQTETLVTERSNGTAQAVEATR
jgi:hypothetical protein